MPDHQDRWLRLDELENAIDNLEMAGLLLERCAEPIRWKWGILTLHQALYGFAVRAVTGTDSHSVLTNPADPNSKLISIWRALERCEDPKHVWAGATPLIRSADEARAIEKVADEFRNSFEHFRPSGWSIEVSGMPTLLGHVLRVIRFLAVESGAVRYAGEHQKGRVIAALSRVAGELVFKDGPVNGS